MGKELLKMHTAAQAEIEAGLKKAEEAQAEAQKRIEKLSDKIKELGTVIKKKELKCLEENMPRNDDQRPDATTMVGPATNFVMQMTGRSCDMNDKLVQLKEIDARSFDQLMYDAFATCNNRFSDFAELLSQSRGVEETRLI